ncbi:uroporphyrinogen-III C-methyltransferase [Clostridium niameyense]|uniref:uroporphyrinogen-III C-methyltransferase n=1 Tax=Clostridium niameyense TaxID=1622073 RepID=A0A6M0RB63_9CLOT|nr:uroporphyrinogen-III C-methyltransferase [Clostridium niameyense]NEZ46997.1 uroporphyrinogen-III C-methyltransferase [Clostridium niameyense]
MGKVYLMGVGPGDEELITLKAIRALKKCTAVMYDRLANHEILSYLNEDCIVYYCGKEPGCHYKTQEEINDIIVELAKKGHIVGRIKGGDPYVFGRGGEEALRLIDENMDFEVIPGITSPIAVLNYAGIPITHRALARSFHVFTGKTKDKLDINWKSAATIGGTLVFLMGIGNLSLIVENLLENGMDENTSVAVIMRGTTSKQKRVIGSLKDIEIKVKENNIVSPSVIVIGEVVRFSNQLNWYENKPLFGQNICITRTKNQSKELKEKLLNLGADVTEINSIKIKNTDYNLDNYIDKLKQYDYIVFTSVNAVKIFFNYLNKKEYDIRNIKAQFAVIGPATARELRSKGVVPTILSKEFVAESLFEDMKKYIKAGDKILVPRSKNAREFLVKALIEEQCMVDEVYIYETLCGDLQDKTRFDGADKVIFTSPSTVRNMISIVGLSKIRSKEVIAIGPITKRELSKNNISCEICDRYYIEGIIDKLLDK